MTPLTSAPATLDVLLNLTTAIGQAASLEPIYEAALDAIHRGLRVDRASILLFDPDGVMRFKAWRGLSDDYRRAVEGHTPWTPGAHDASPIAISDVDADPGLGPYLETIHAEGIAAMAFVPLVTDGGVTGKFMLYYDEPHVASSTELRLASVIAAQVAFAVQRVRAEETGRAREAMFRQLAETVPQIIWTTLPDGEPGYFNPRWYDFTGLPPGSFDRNAWRECMHPDDRHPALDAWMRSFVGRQPYQFELRLRDARTGAYRWHLARSVPVLDETGAVVQWIGSSTDIDDQKRAERTSRFIAAASGTLATLVDYHTALQRVAELAVPDFADWCAVDMADECGGLRRLALCHADPAKVHLAFELERRYPPRHDSDRGADRVLKTGEPEMMTEIPDSLLTQVAYDAEHLAAIRTLGLRSYISVPLIGAGRTIGVITFIATDDSGRRYDEHDLSVARELAYRAGIAIENGRLYSDLQQAARQKDEFLAVLAHELRNPLAPIRTALHLIEVAGDDAARRDQACTIMNRQLRQMVRLVDDLLDVSRITRGQIELQRHPSELAAILQSAIETSRPVIESNGHELTVTFPREPIVVQADSARIAQVFSNLLNNAAKYTPRGGHIMLAAESDGTTSTVRVRDTGIGIPKEMLESVFNMFVQVDRSFERSSGGLGIGLTLVKRLVEMHGGTVEAHSDGAGTGTEFVVRLPTVAVDAHLRADDRPRGRIPVSTTSRRVLVADDNDDAAECLAAALRLMGHDVRTVGDGLSAVEVGHAYRPELVFLDLGMPRMDGYEAARRLRSALGSQCRIVAVTGWGQAEDQRRSKEAGFDRHLIKPIDVLDIATLIEALTHGDVAASINPQIGRS